MNEKRPEPMHPFVDIDGFIAEGKQFDLDITLANDHRDVIYGIIRDCFKEPVKEAVVKLVEVDYKYGKKELKPVSHTFTDKDGEFVFGPLCPGKKYAIQIWKDDVKHIKVCAKCHHEGKCLKGIDLDCDCKDDYKKDYQDRSSCSYVEHTFCLCQYVLGKNSLNRRRTHRTDGNDYQRTDRSHYVEHFTRIFHRS